MLDYKSFKNKQEQPDFKEKAYIIIDFFKSIGFDRVIFSTHFKERLNNVRESNFKITASNLRAFFNISTQQKQSLASQIKTLPILEYSEERIGAVVTDSPLALPEVKEKIAAYKKTIASQSMSKQKELLNSFMMKLSKPSITMIVIRKRDRNGELLLLSTIIKKGAAEPFSVLGDDQVFVIKPTSV
jgi:hypothetical protein